jgi:acetoin utilization protein AcuC
VAAAVGFYYGEDLLRYRFHPSHPLNPLRLALTVSLTEACGLLDAAAVRPPRRASREELLTVHRAEYVDAVATLSRTGGAALGYGLGTGDNPVFPGMHDAAALIAGTSLQAAEDILAGAVLHAVHWAGGLHHAMPARASGFCVYNDAALAVARFRRAGLRVAYVDLDAHHGDGVEAVFREDPGVLTVSIHESGRYLFPGTGFPHQRGAGAGHGYAVNIPLEPGTDDDSWWACFREAVPRLLRAYRPDVLVSQHGCDAHWLDPLTHLCLTSVPMVEAARVLRQLAAELCGGRWLLLGGGGYDIWRVVPAVWTQAWAVAADREVPEAVPERWRARWQPQAPVPLPRSFRDLTGPPLGEPRMPLRPAEEIAAANRRAVREALAGVAWLAAAEGSGGGAGDPQGDASPGRS